MAVDLAELVVGLERRLAERLPRGADLQLFHDGSGVRVAGSVAKLEALVMLAADEAARDSALPGRVAFETERARFPAGETGAAPGNYACLAVSFAASRPDALVSAPNQLLLDAARALGGVALADAPSGANRRVRVFLPEEPAPAATLPLEGRDLASTGGGARVLLVEDEAPLRETATRVLQRLGYTVISAADGLEALAVVRTSERFDLIIADLIMPNMGGLDLYLALKESGQPFLFSSGYQERELPAFVSRGEVPLLQKPWSVPELAAKLRELLGTKREEAGERRD